MCVCVCLCVRARARACLCMSCLLEIVHLFILDEHSHHHIVQVPQTATIINMCVYMFAWQAWQERKVSMLERATINRKLQNAIYCIHYTFDGVKLIFCVRFGPFIEYTIRILFYSPIDSPVRMCSIKIATLFYEQQK